MLSLLVVGVARSAGAVNVDPAYAQRVNGFGFKSLNQLAKTQPRDNIFISPISLSMALTMTYNGAAGDTLKAMRKALNISGFSPGQANRNSSNLMKSLQDPASGVKLNIANSVWARKGIKFKPDFLQTNKQFFNAEIKTVDFGPEAVKQINTWVKTKTQGKIPKIIDQMRGNMIMYLLNAVYFKGAWTMPFEKALTKDGPFSLADGKKITVPMMHRQGFMGYYHGAGFQAVSLPYASGRMRMVVLLPEKPSGLHGLVSQLTSQKWDTWLRSFTSASVNLSMPKFKIEYKAEDELKAALSAMGMAVAFDSAKANFSKMAVIPGQNVFISQVVHKTFLDVNEAGTEAAAATSVGMAMTAAPTQPVEMNVDHPFLCAIVDSDTGAVLFVGAVMNPKG